MANRKLQDAMPLAPLKIVAMGGCGEIVNEQMRSSLQDVKSSCSFKQTGFYDIRLFHRQLFG